MQIDPTFLPVLYYNRQYHKERREIELTFRDNRTTLSDDEMADQIEDFEAEVDKTGFRELRDTGTVSIYQMPVNVLFTEIYLLKSYLVQGRVANNTCMIVTTDGSYVVNKNMDEVIELTGICKKLKLENH